MDLTLDNLPEDVLTVIFLNLTMGDAISLYKIRNKNLRSAIQKTKFDFFHQFMPKLITVTQFRSIFKNAIGIKIDLFNGTQTFTDSDLECIIPKNLYGEPIKGIRVFLDHCNTITDNQLKYFKGVHTLELFGCKTNISDIGWEYLRGIHTLKIANSNITDSGLQYLRGIHTLNIQYCANITDTGLQYLRGIRALNIDSCDNITDTGLQYLSGIHILNINNCLKITNDGLKYINGIHSLSILNNSHFCNFNITDDGLKHLGDNIHTLKISQCDITDDGLKYLGTLPNLMHLNYWGCTNTTSIGRMYTKNIKHINKFF